MEEKEKVKPFLTSKDLVDTLLILSETTKALAEEVELLPVEDSEGGENGERKECFRKDS